MAGSLGFVSTLIAALGCGLMAGVFFAFSSFVMKALARLSSAQGIAAMQAINVAVINTVFLGALFGTGALCVVLAVGALTGWQTPGAGYLLAGSVLYLAGDVLVTMAFNVPLNRGLAAVEPASAEGAAVWARYLERWTAWNHVRTVAALAAAACFTLALARAV
jgi:uncharacterized membrane protein